MQERRRERILAERGVLFAARRERNQRGGLVLLLAVLDREKISRQGYWFSW